MQQHLLSFIYLISMEELEQLMPQELKELKVMLVLVEQQVLELQALEQLLKVLE